MAEKICGVYSVIILVDMDSNKFFPITKSFIKPS